MLKSSDHLVFTIIAPNYAPQAMILGESIAKVMPQVDFRIVVLQDCMDVRFIQDGIDAYLDTLPFKCNHAANSFLDFDWIDFPLESAVNQYDLLEFATSVKPSLIKNFLKQGYGRVTYLDPDIQVFSDFEETLAESKCISLTPHILNDLPDDNKTPNQESILYAGIFNLGFISVNQDSYNFLNWWESKLTKFCTMEVKSGLHVDQRWVDWAATFADIDIIKNPGMNVAYWNLHERTILKEPNYKIRYFDNTDHKLYFYHFSGFLGPSSKLLSKHNTRKFKIGPGFKSLLEGYATERAKWKRKIGPRIWTLGGRIAGSSLPLPWRRNILNFVRQNGVPHETNIVGSLNIQGSTCSCGNCGSDFARIATLNLFDSIKSGVIDGIDRSNGNSLEETLDNLGYLNRTKKSAKQDAPPESKVLLIGYFAAPTGVGQIVRNTLQILEEAGIEPNIHIIRTGFDDERLLSQFLRKNSRSGTESVVIAFVNADMWVEHVVKPKLIDLNRQFVAAIWAWELETVPEYFREIAKYASKVFAISKFSAAAFSTFLNKEIEVFPTYGNLKDIINYEIEAKKKVHPYILTRFDSKSVIKRKNPEGVLDTWDAIKDKFPNYNLIIKSTDLTRFADPLLLNRIESDHRITLIDEVHGAEENEKLLKEASVFISLHRAEGLGLNILESLVSGVPTVFTNYSGLAEEVFRFGFPVSYNLVEIGDGAEPYSSIDFWADPSISNATIQLEKALTLVETNQWQTEFNSFVPELEKFLEDARSLTFQTLLGFLAKENHISKNTLSRKRIEINRNLLSVALPFYTRLPDRIKSHIRILALKYFSI